MSRYVTESYFETVRTIPIALPQTELLRETSVLLCSVPVALGETLEIRSLAIQIIKVLTPGVLARSEVTSLGAASVGIQREGMATGMIARVPIENVGAVSHNCDQPTIITSPGLYNVIVRNHVNNLDLAVSVTGSMKILR